MRILNRPRPPSNSLNIEQRWDPVMFNTGSPASGAHCLIFDHEMNPGTVMGRLWQMIAVGNCNDYRLPIMKSYSHKWLNYPDSLLNSRGTWGRVVSRTRGDRDRWFTTQSNVTRALWVSAPRTRERVFICGTDKINSEERCTPLWFDWSRAIHVKFGCEEHKSCFPKVWVSVSVCFVAPGVFLDQWSIWMMINMAPNGSVLCLHERWWYFKVIK